IVLIRADHSPHRFLKRCSRVQTLRTAAAQASAASPLPPVQGHWSLNSATEEKEEDEGMSRKKQRDQRRRNKGWFRRGFDARRHQLTTEDRRKGGQTTASRYLCIGRWYTDWYDRADR